MAELNATL